MPEELEELTSVPCPHLLRYLWKMFLELSGSRQRGHDGLPQAFTWQEIQGWMFCTKRRLDVWEIEVIKRLDVLFVNKQSEFAEK